MKHLISLLCILLPACVFAQTSGQNVIQKKNASAGFSLESFTLSNSQLIGRTSGGTLSGITLGSGLSLSGTTLTSSGGSLTIGTTAISGGTSGHVLYNNAGTLDGLNIAATYAPIASPTFTGTLTIGNSTLTTSGFTHTNPIFPTRQVGFSTSGIIFTDVGGSGFYVRVNPATPAANVDVTLPTGGTIISNTDTGTVTNPMLAGSIALSKLSTTGTANSTTYLRGDGAWTAIDLSSYLTTATAASTYLPLAGGTMTGTLVLPAGTVSAAALTLGDADSGLYTSSATTSLDFAVAGSRMLQINTTGVRLNNDTQDTIWRRSDVGMLIFHGHTSSSTGIGSSGYNPGINFGSVAVLRWTNDSPASTPDLILLRDTSARLQLGADHATAATNQTIKAHDVTTGTGASLDLRGGNGSSAGGTVTISTSATTTPAVRMTVKASGVINMSGMPTSDAGLSSGDLWNNAGVVNIVP